MNQQLFNYFTQVKQQVLAVATQKGMNPDGEILSSIEITETPDGYSIEANPAIQFTRSSLLPDRNNHNANNPNLPEIIADWLDARELNVKPYAGPNAIHKNQTRLYRAGSSGRLEVPLNTDRLNQVFARISTEHLQHTTDEIFNTLLGI